MLSAFWVFGGMVLIGCGLFFLSRQRWRGRPMWFGAIALVLPIGYLFFWGTYGAAVWGAPWYLGPYYYMPIFAPLIILGTGGFVYFVREFGKVAKWTLVGMLVLSTFVTTQAIVKNWGFSQDDRRLNTALTNADLHDALVFLPGFYGPRILHPFATARNNWNVSGDVIYAVNRTESQNASVVTDFRSRKAYVVEIKGQYRDHPKFDPHLSSSLTELTLVRGKAIDIAIDFKNPPLPDAIKRNIVSVSVTTKGKADTYVIDENAQRGTRERLRVRVTSTGVSATGPIVKHSTAPSDSSTPEDLLVQISASNKNGNGVSIYFRRVGVARRGDKVSILLPGQKLSTYFPEPLKFTAR
jgi:hypothetical protein